MGDRAKFKIATLLDMAAIPEDRLDRFLAELPDILRTTREIVAALPTLAAKAKAEAPWPKRLLPLSVFEKAFLLSVTGGAGWATWIDDDKGLATVNMAWGKSDKPFFTQTESMRGPKGDAQ